MTNARENGSIHHVGNGEIFVFGRFVLDPARQQLKKSGYVLRLPQQPFRLLLLLASRAGEVISREEIQQEIWGADTFVDFEQGTNAAIRQIRAALGDNAEVPRYVETLPRVGYSFVAPVERIRPGLEALVPVPPAPAASPARKRRFLRPGVALLILAVAVVAGVAIALFRSRKQIPPQPAGGGMVIAVLPFRSIGIPPEVLDARVVTEELRAVMGRLLGSRMQVLDAHTATAVGNGATLWITGTIQRTPTGVEAIVSGVDPVRHIQVWTQPYARSAENTAGLPIEIAHFTTLKVAQRYLPPVRREPRLLTRASPRVLSLYRQARVERTRPIAHRHNERAKALFEEVVRLEPRFAEAWSGLADLCVETMIRDANPAARTEGARCAAANAQRALAIQPANAEAHSAVGLVAFQYDHDFGKAEDELRRAVRADPGNPEGHTNLALLLDGMGQSDEALEEWSVAQQLDPVRLDLSLTQAALYRNGRRYEDAIACYREMLAVEPDTQSGMLGLVSIFIVQRNWREAIAITRKLSQQPPYPGDAPADQATFRREYKRLEPYMDDGFRRGAFNAYGMAIYYVELGDRERAFTALGRAVDERLPAVSRMMVDPRINPLRTDPRFRALLMRAGMAR